MADIKIDSKVFQERMSHFINAWKADKRSGDALFGGVSSMVVLMGKVDEEPEFYKNNAMHVRLTESSSAQCRPALTIAPAVLATRLRIPNDADALHSRHALHPHDPKERFAAFPAASYSLGV
jgi:hypothetical protein